VSGGGLRQIKRIILCLWFRASFIYINNCPTRCNTKQSIYYSASTLYMFRVSTTPIIRSTQNCNYGLRYWSYFLCSYLPPTRPTWPRWREVAAQKIWPVPEAVVTVLCTPDDGCGWHPKHVEWTCRIINRLLCVASRCTIININIKKLVNSIYQMNRQETRYHSRHVLRNNLNPNSARTLASLIQAICSINPSR